MSGIEAEGEVPERGIISRIGLSILSLFFPGLGLVRIGLIRLGLIFALIYGAFSGLIVLYFVYGPTLSFGALLVIVIAGLVTILICQLGSAIVTFLRSRYVRDTMLIWSRWSMLLIYIAAIFGINQIATGNVNSHYRSFYVPAVSMSPSLLLNDRFYVEMQDFGIVKRGDIVVFRANNVEYVKRVVGLPSDRVRISGGQLEINGIPATVRTVSSHTDTLSCDISFAERDDASATIFLEVLPGEASGGHLIADCGLTSSDDFAETTVPPEHYFMLGDNRDLSTDSRFEAPVGVGMVSNLDIIGKPIFIHWSDDRKRIGKKRAMFFTNIAKNFCAEWEW